jgi:hypothetical protein
MINRELSYALGRHSILRPGQLVSSSSNYKTRATAEMYLVLIFDNLMLTITITAGLKEERVHPGVY